METTVSNLTLESAVTRRWSVPWFLLSGVLMFVGCFLLNAAVHERKDELLPVLGLVAVFNLYEGAVLGLAWWLSRRGAGTEARHLCVLAAVLLADTTFVYNEVAIAGPVVGGVVAGLGLLLAVVKSEVIRRIAGLTLRPAESWAVAWSLASVFGLPALARLVGDDGYLRTGFTHPAAWWFAWVFALGVWTIDRAWSAEPAQDRSRRLRLALLIVPLLSTVVHVWALGWLYRTTLYPADFGPVLLGLSVVAVLRCEPGWSHRRGLATACGVMSVLVCVGGEPSWRPEGWPAYAAWSSWRSVLLAGAVAYAALWWARRTPALLLAVPTMLVLALLGPNGEAVFERIGRLHRVAPRSVGQWGVVAVMAAFGLLGVGAWSALRRRVRPPE